MDVPLFFFDSMHHLQKLCEQPQDELRNLQECVPSCTVFLRHFHTLFKQLLKIPADLYRKISVIDPK